MYPGLIKVSMPLSLSLAVCGCTIYNYKASYIFTHFHFFLQRQCYTIAVIVFDVHCVHK